MSGLHFLAKLWIEMFEDPADFSEALSQQSDDSGDFSDAVSQQSDDFWEADSYESDVSYDPSDLDFSSEMSFDPEDIC